MFLNKNIFCDPSLELSHGDGSHEGSQHMFSLRNKKNYLRIILNSPFYLKLCRTDLKPPHLHML